MMKKEEITSLIDKGYLISPELAEEEINKKELSILVNSKIKTKNKPIVLSKDIYNTLKKTKELLNINWVEFEKSKALMERGKNGKIYESFIDVLENNIIEVEGKENVDYEELAEDSNNVVVLDCYEKKPRKREIKDFVHYYRKRYEFIKDLLIKREELRGTISINKSYNKKRGEILSVIGMITEKNETKNKNIMLTIEDITGKIKVLINKDNLELYSMAKNLVLDDVIGSSGIYGVRILFANNIFLPDTPYSKELKKAQDECYAVFISDIHVGSKMFLPEDFKKFIKWINGESGSEEHKKIAMKTKYLFIVGDLVDGVGVYPEQDKELIIKDIKKQYEKCAEYLEKIRKDVMIIICPGNHDALRMAEPQPKINPKLAKEMYNMKNVIMVSNPAMVNIHASENFLGFDVLLYHGYSFDYYVGNVDNIRLRGGYDRADLIMKFLLQRRHLAPTHGSTLFIPETERDPLVISKVPDIFATGHIHKSSVSQYNNITTICGSCWQAKTGFQEKVGHNPEPSRVPVVNLKTREVKILKFGS